jgi:periplasmic copper chaperone A
MKMRILVPVLLALALTAAALVSFALKADGAAGGIVVTGAWARATPPGATTGALYVTIENRGGTTDRLLSVASPAAGSTMLHTTLEESGVSKMRESDGGIAPGAVLQMKPGGTHVMLMGLASPLKEGETISLTLSFEKAGAMTVDAKVAGIGADGPVD